MALARVNMDLLRIFLGTAFGNYELSPEPATMSNSRLLIEEEVFLRVVKKSYFNLSDDHIRLVYKLYQDTWCKGRHKDKEEEKCLFNSLNVFTSEVLCLKKGDPVVRFEHLFRWRELTQVIGEDVLICSFLAHQDVYKHRVHHFSWPSVLQCDNVYLDYLKSHRGLVELHHHLKASTDVFGLSWICLMNHVTGRAGDFRKICGSQLEADELYAYYIEAAYIRCTLYKYVKDGLDELALAELPRKKWLCLFGDVDTLRAEIDNMSWYDDCGCALDYASFKEGSVYASERYLLYEVMKRIYEGEDNVAVSRLLWRYLLIKAKVRNKLVQNNENVGFGNFDTFEKRKEVFIERYAQYAALLLSLPVSEAAKHHGVRYVETRIAPKSPGRVLAKHLRIVIRQIESGMRENAIKYGLIYHFIKKKDMSSSSFLPRNYAVREEIRRQAIAIKSLVESGDYPQIVGIDAANSEFFCRPEVFAQAYRYLSRLPLQRTFHVGEDFYDLTDGLRAIDEAVSFLHLQRGDRLGHCLALGLSAKEYYKKRHDCIPVPKQVLLDNLVWAFYKAKMYNITIEPQVEMMIMDRYTELVKMYSPSDNILPSMTDYYHSMALRGDAPLGMEDEGYGEILDNWNAYDMDNSGRIPDYRADKSIKRLYDCYHFHEEVREDGDKVVEFRVTDGYCRLIDSLQERMIEDIGRKHLCVECCPSSNFRIARLERYDEHPIFRMCPVDNRQANRLPVTINTDDLGIFTTSLENEYALILLAMEKMDKKDDAKVHTTDIEDWMERIIDNGNSYAFSQI